MATINDSSGYGFVSLVGAGPGDPGLITLRGMECLGEADVVVYDRLANPLLLRMALQAEWIPVGKQPNNHPIPQEQINTLLIEKAELGKRVVRLKGGDPFIFGRGGEEAEALADASIPFEIVPGVTSAIAAPAYAGIPLTHRNLASSAALITGHRTEWVGNPEDDWQEYSLGADTLVFLMGVKNLARIIDQLLAAGRAAETPAALIEQGTTAAQKTIVGTLSDIVKRAEEIHSPAVIVIGEVVRLRDQLRWFDSLHHRPLFGLRVLNTKSISNPVKAGSIWATQPQDEFDRQVHALGGEAIHLPVIQIIPSPDQKPIYKAVQCLIDGLTYSWVIFTSAYAVTVIFDQLTTLGFDARALRGVQVAAVGQATSQVLRGFGILPDFMPTRFSGADLGKQLPIQPGERVLLPRSEVALSELPEILKERDIVVDEVSVYTVKSAPPDAIVLDQLVKGKIDVVAFFSPSGLYGLTEMLENSSFTASLEEILLPLTVACIGPTTEKAALEMGLRVDVVAQEFTSTGLVQELVRWRKHS